MKVWKMDLNQIPVMTHPLSSGWSQPDRKTILIDDTHAVMEREIFKELLEYSYSLPTGVYPGKIFKGRRNEIWNLIWFGECKNITKCSIHNREIILVS